MTSTVTLRVDPDGRGIWLGDAHIAYAEVDRHEVVLGSGLSPFRTRHAILPFENGLSLSVLWGSGSYSSNHDDLFGSGPFVEEPDEVEIGVLGRDGALLPLPTGDTVMGYVPVSDLAANWRRLSELPSATKAITAGWEGVAARADQ